MAEQPVLADLVEIQPVLPLGCPFLCVDELASRLGSVGSLDDSIAAYRLDIALIGDQAAGIVAQQTQGHPTGLVGIEIKQHHLLPR